MYDSIDRAIDNAEENDRVLERNAKIEQTGKIQ